MASLTDKVHDLYIRFMVWLGAEPPTGYEHLIGRVPVPTEYTLQAGETLFSVARKFGVHYDRIAQANAISHPEAVQPGQTIIIPPDDWEPEAGPLQPEVAAPPAPAEVVEPGMVTVPEEVVEAAPPAEEEVPLPPFEEEEAPAPVEQVELAEEMGPEPVKEPEWLTEPEPPAERPSVTIVETPPAEKPRWRDVSELLETTAEAPEAVEEAVEEVVEEYREEVAEEAVEEITAPPLPPQQAPQIDRVFRYEVQRGDTLNAIARRYGLTVKDIIEANNIADPDRLFPGQKLIIPGYEMPRAAPPEEAFAEPTPRPRPGPDEFFVHTVDVGDTLSSIAKRFGVTVRRLIEVNDIEDPNMIRVGQRLVIPHVLAERPAPAPPKPMPVKAPPKREPKPLALTGINPQFPPLGPLEATRALYVSYFGIGHAEMRQRVFELLDTTEFNAVVIDAKSDYGWISYPTQVPLAREIDADRPSARDFQEVMDWLKERGIYTIARIVVFKDSPLAKSYPELAVKAGNTADLWQDREEAHWADPFMKPVWDYNIEVAIEAAQKGFDEIQFDYLRFPTQSQVGVPQFSQEVTRDNRVAAITGFLSVAKGQLDSLGVKVAARTLGYTSWRKDDTLIGHDLERLAPYLDVLCPMLYPSTFSNGIPGYKMAVAYPYEVVYESAQRAVERVSRFGCVVRPWIQDFPDYRFDKRVYGKEEIRAQMRGCFDAGCTGFMVWNPKVEYTQDAYAPVTGQA